LSAIASNTYRSARSFGPDVQTAPAIYPLMRTRAFSGTIRHKRMGLQLGREDIQSRQVRASRLHDEARSSLVALLCGRARRDNASFHPDIPTALDRAHNNCGVSEADDLRRHTFRKGTKRTGEFLIASSAKGDAATTESMFSLVSTSRRLGSSPAASVISPSASASDQAGMKILFNESRDCQAGSASRLMSCSFANELIA
jgi:hypothetical protein